MALNLSDFPTELLLKIFNYLHPIDFICAAEATKNPHFRSSLRSAFLKKFQETVWQFDFIALYSASWHNQNRTHWNSTNIYFDNLATCLKVCKYFGSQMHSLTVTVRNFDYLHTECIQRHFGFLNHYISKYCRHLQTLQYNRTIYTNLILMGFGGPMPSITSLTLQDCQINGQMNIMNYWFPGIQTLNMVSRVFLPNNTVVTHHINLLELNLKVGRLGLSQQHTVAMLDANPQIIKLQLNGDINIDIMQAAAGTNIQSLELRSSLEGHRFFQGQYNNNLLFRNVTEFNLNFGWVGFFAFGTIPFTIPMLRKFRCRCFTLTIFEPQFLNFIRNNNIETVELDGSTLSIENVVGIITSCQHLTNFSCYIRRNADVGHLSAHLENHIGQNFSINIGRCMKTRKLLQFRR